MKFENAGWAPDDEADFHTAFQETFGLPLNRLIDPSPVPLGNVGVLAYLLGIQSVQDIAEYHQESFDFLCDSNYLVQRSHDVRGCTQNFCKKSYQQVADENRTVCADCGKPLETWQVIGIERNQETIVELVKNVLERSTGMAFGNKPKKLEGKEYYAISSKDELSENQTICVVFADRVTLATRLVFERASLPLIVVRPNASAQKIFVDHDNIGHISLAYLIAAQADLDECGKCEQLCARRVKQLLLTNKEAIERAARHSHRILTEEREKLSGPSYEVEIFNLLRMIFPHSFQLGRLGKEEPDGFACIPNYKEINDLVDTGSWNFTYDAKYSDKAKGYDFGSDERRQMLHYITKFTNKKQVLIGENGIVRAHIIVSNNLASKKMRAGAKFLYGAEGLKRKAKDVRLILMRESFVMRLFEWVQQNSTEVAQKRPRLYEALINLLESEPTDGYLELAEEAAGRVIETVEGIYEIEKRISRKELTEAIDNKKSLL